VAVERHYPKWLLKAFAAGTVLFVVAQVIAGLTLRTTTYPIVAFPMFAESPKVEVQPYIDVVTADGATHRATPADFGVERDQLRFFVGRNLAGADKTLRMGVSDKLAIMGGLWAKKHGQPVVRAVKLSFEEHTLDGSNKVTVEQIASWTAAP
jgi:hypothetical protein